MKLRTLLLSIILLLNFGSFAQTASGSLEVYLNNYLNNIPGSSGNNFTKPSTNQLNQWAVTVDKILSQNINQARTDAATFNYQITEFTDTVYSTGHTYYILEEKAPQTYYWGTYIFNPTACRNKLIIQAPHPKYDSNTGKQSIFYFARLNAKALFLSGTHRCNNDTLSSCSGSTKACSSTSSAYRISDNAHNVYSAFQKTTERIFQDNSLSVFVQLHGFAKKSTDPYVIMSNGTRQTPTIDYVSIIKNELALVDTSLTFKIAHINTSWTRLIAFTNTQGRFINGSSDPCLLSATNSQGNFVHMEQEKSKLRADSNGWYKLYIALSNAFPCNPSNISNTSINMQTISIFPNPCRSNIVNIEGANITRINLFDLKGRLLIDTDYASQKRIRLNLSNLHSGLYLLTIESTTQIYHTKLIVQH